MGDDVHREIAKITSAPLRVYAPVGRHHDLLAYLVRRILENGASSSFMNQFADDAVAIEDLVVDPYETGIITMDLSTGDQIFAPERKNSAGFDEADSDTLRAFSRDVALAKMPLQPRDATTQDIAQAFQRAHASSWSRYSLSARADILDRIADQYEQNAGKLYQLLVHEAGKTIDDAAGEVREAVDFCRYYALQTRRISPLSVPRGIVIAISPWNFPLAIFTGQIAAALGAGNMVLAKPAEQTPGIAALAVSLMHAAGVPEDGIQLLCGDGAVVGAALTDAGKADMVVFTGSTETAKLIEMSIARSAKPFAPLIAETGGLNAMIVDSSALLERAVDDIISSAFRSAGQRCSALRLLYVQEDIADDLVRMLREAAAMMTIGNPSRTSTDIGPVIDQDAKAQIDEYVARAAREGRLIWQGVAPQTGCFCPPSMLSVKGIADLKTEIFGPVLHVATYRAGSESAVVDAINRSGYGLTFGMHSRIDANIEAVCAAINVGNVYINRNQIGAVVGSQPFGGHGLSGTGPKAGGPLYLAAFLQKAGTRRVGTPEEISLPSPSGERNTYSVTALGKKVLVLHADSKTRQSLATIAASFGNEVEMVSAVPDDLTDIDAVITQSVDTAEACALRQALCRVSNRVIPVITDDAGYVWLQKEKHLCRDMTASGGNVDLLMK